MRQIPTEVLHLWRIELRGLGLRKEQREPFSMHVASKEQFAEAQVVREIKQRFTPQWWEEYLITDVVYSGKLHMIDGVALYEQD